MRYPVLAILILATACEMPWEVEFEQPLSEVPAAYRSWFWEVASCMSLSPAPGRFARIDWYASGSIFHRTSGEQALGLWTEPHKIVIRTDYTLDERVVKHELVHDLLGTGTHRSHLFDTCGRRGS